MSGAERVFAGTFGGADAGTRGRLLLLGPAQPPLAPTGGDALIYIGLVLGNGSSSLLDPTLNTSSKVSHLESVVM